MSKLKIRIRLQKKTRENRGFQSFLRVLWLGIEWFVLIPLLYRHPVTHTRATHTYLDLC